MYCEVCKSVNRKTMMNGTYMPVQGVTVYTCEVDGNTETVKEDAPEVVKEDGSVPAYVLTIALPEPFIATLFNFAEDSSINESLKWVGFEGTNAEFMQYFHGMINHPSNAERANLLNMIYYGDIDKDGGKVIAVTGNGKASEANSKVILIGLLLVQMVMKTIAAEEYVKATLEDALGLITDEKSILKDNVNE